MKVRYRRTFTVLVNIKAISHNSRIVDMDKTSEIEQKHKYSPVHLKLCTSNTLNTCSFLQLTESF